MPREVASGQCSGEQGAVVQAEVPCGAGRRLICARNECQRIIRLCSKCDRGHRYCSPHCRRKARQASLRAAGKRYQRSRPGRFNHAARQARYRARRNAQQKVTHPSTQMPTILGKLSSSTEPTAFAVITLPVMLWHAKKYKELIIDRLGHLRAVDLDAPHAVPLCARTCARCCRLMSAAGPPDPS